MRFKIYPYRQGSASAKELAVALDGKVLKVVGSRYRPRRGDVVINWGASNLPDFGPATVLNKDIATAGCKKATFIALDQAGVRVPDFWTGKDKLDEAGEALVFPIVCRTKLRGHSGDGIVIANNKDELVEAPLYTKYVKKKDEYRVHVMSAPDPDPDVTQYMAFFIQRKARKLDVEDPNWQVRNLEGGFVFVEVEYNDVPPDVINQAYQAMAALGLDFGGVDVIWNEHEGNAYVLEVNTACGLEERTAQRYEEAIHNLFPAGV